MRLKTAAWNTAAFDTAALEHGFIDASIIHGFNDCAKVLLRIADPTGEKLQKYDSDAVGDEIYVGSGKALLYNDNGTCVFNGRILSSERTGKILTLTCEDWMNQLKDERVHYDFREDLDGSGLRASGAMGDLTDGTTAYRAPAYTNAGNYYLLDDDMTWAIDEWNGYDVVLLNDNFGTQTIRLGPYYHTILSGTATNNGWPNAWTDDANHDDFDSDQVTCFGYHWFFLKVTEGSLYSSMSSLTLNLSLRATNIDTSLGVTVTVYDGAGYEKLEYIALEDNETQRRKIEIPAEIWGDIVDADGIVKI